MSSESDSEQETLLNARRNVASDSEESGECVSHDSRVSDIKSDDQSRQTESDDNDEDDDDDESLDEEGEYCSQDAYIESELDDQGSEDSEVAALHMDFFVVPTSGPFYEHVDRFGNNLSTRHSQPGQNVWEIKDDQKWKHDKFEEINSESPPNEEGKNNSQGILRGHSNNRESTSGYLGIRRPRVDAHHRIVKGRGPVRFKPAAKENYGRFVTGRGPISDRISAPKFPYNPSHCFNEDISVATIIVPVINIPWANHSSSTRDRNVFLSNNAALLRINTRDDANPVYGYYSDIGSTANPQLQSFGPSPTSMQGRASQKNSANPFDRNYQRPSASNISPEDHSFLVASGFLPVMPYGVKHLSALGFPAVDVLLSGCVAQPELGFQNSQITWVPVPADPPGALSSRQSFSPSMSLDGGYSGQLSWEMGSLNAFCHDTGGIGNSNTWTPQKPELATTDFGQSKYKHHRCIEEFLPVKH